MRDRLKSSFRFMGRSIGCICSNDGATPSSPPHSILKRAVAGPWSGLARQHNGLALGRRSGNLEARRSPPNSGGDLKVRHYCALHRRALIALGLLVLVMALLLFGAAGTLRYWQAWLFLATYFIASLALTVYLMKRDPALLARRMSGGPFAEREPAQKVIMSFASVGFIALLVLPALDHRFGWSHMGRSVAVAGDLFVLLGWLGIFFVFRENSFASATIESAAEQRVISSGPYAWVRHPMYATALVMLLGIPIALGSWWGALVVVAILPALIWRLLDEERFLVRNLPEYVAYQRRVRFRLLPLVW
jgi:protein-S-isoprenylcysteine O-methyltransferase Ste14